MRDIYSCALEVYGSSAKLASHVWSRIAISSIIQGSVIQIEIVSVDQLCNS